MSRAGRTGATVCRGDTPRLPAAGRLESTWPQPSPCRASWSARLPAWELPGLGQPGDCVARDSVQSDGATTLPCSDLPLRYPGEPLTTIFIHKKWHCHASFRVAGRVPGRSRGESRNVGYSTTQSRQQHGASLNLPSLSLLTCDAGTTQPFRSWALHDLGETAPARGLSTGLAPTGAFLRCECHPAHGAIPARAPSVILLRSEAPGGPPPYGYRETSTRFLSLNPGDPSSQGSVRVDGPVGAPRWTWANGIAWPRC